MLHIYVSDVLKISYFFLLRPVEHLNEPLSSYNQSYPVEHKVSGKLESPFSDPTIDRNTNGICELKQLRNQNPHRIIIGHLDINSVRNKSESLVLFEYLNYYT